VNLYERNRQKVYTEISSACMTVGFSIILLAIAWQLTGCVLVYAPSAERVAAQMHDQEAEYMAIEQRIDPRVSDEMTGVAGIKIRGDVGSGNRAKAEATRVER
jgi:hypothetical protein